MPRARSFVGGQSGDLLGRVEHLVRAYRVTLESSDLRNKVLALLPIFHSLRDLGASLIPTSETATAARDRILQYLRAYPQVVIDGDELMVVAGIQDWPRRVRELRSQFGWRIASGLTMREMLAAEGQDAGTQAAIAPGDYILLDATQDKEAAHRWHLANETRRMKGNVSDRLLTYLRKNVGSQITGEELRYVARNATEWARRIRELRSEQGWPILTKASGRPDLPIGVYVLEADRQSPVHDRNILDGVRRAVLRRDEYRCTECGWNQGLWNRSDARHLELHHRRHHVHGGENTEQNLVTLCTVCHDAVHAKSK